MKRSMSRRSFVGSATGLAAGAGVVVSGRAGETPPREEVTTSATQAVITDFGAKGRTHTGHRHWVRRSTVRPHGGGTVVIPPGEFLSGTCELKSRITLYLAPGAVLEDPAT